MDLRTVVLSRIRAVKAGLDIPTSRIEAHYLAGGRVVNVINALIASKGAKINLTWDTATAIDLAGRDIFDAVQTSVNPKVIDCPSQDGPRATIDAVRMGRKKMFASSAKAERDLGYQVVPVDAALRRAVDWFKASGYER